MFNLIDSQGKSVIICYKDSMDLVERLYQKGPSYSLMKKLAKYSVNIYDNDFKTLKNLGVVEEKIEGIYAVPFKEQYDEQVGLHIDSAWEDTSLII